MAAPPTKAVTHFEIYLPDHFICIKCNVRQTTHLSAFYGYKNLVSYAVSLPFCIENVTFVPSCVALKRRTIT